MKGLIIKDLMCLRKQRVTFIYIVAFVLIVAIMYVLSAKYGNLALAGKDMMAENGLTEIDIKNLASLALILFMFLPLAMVGDVSSIFAADGKAGFYSVSATLPLSIEKRVLAKYLTISAFFGIGVATDLVIALVISSLTDMLTFGEFFKIIITSASALFIYGALICIYMFLFGYGKESYAQTCSVLTIALALALANFKTTKLLLISIFVEGAEVLDVNPIEASTNVIMKHSLKAFVVAIAVGVLSYALSVLIAKRKRGIV